MKRSIKVDEFGIPVMGRPEIEDKTEAITQVVAPDCLKQPILFPIREFCRVLEEKRDVQFIFTESLGRNRGYRRLGSCDIEKRIIQVDKELVSSSGAFNFTLAHEIGHFVLHRKVRLPKVDDSTKFVDTRSTVTLSRIRTSAPRDIIEWQANFFAAALLMPRATVPTAVKDAQWEIGINRNLGTIRLDSQKGTQNDYRRILAKLTTIYEVSRGAIQIRLRELNIVRYAPLADENIYRIDEIIDDLFI